MNLFQLAGDILSTVWLVFAVSAITIRYRPEFDAFQALFALTKWPAAAYPPWVFVDALLHKVDGLLVVRVLTAAILAYMWWLYRNNGNDDWKKKLKKKISAKVERAGARLAVVPAPA